MARPKKCPVREAAIILLTEDLKPLTRDVTQELILKLQSTLEPHPAAALRDTPSGPLGRFLYELLFALPKIATFLNGGPETIVGDLVAQPDKRVEILREFAVSTEFTVQEKFKRFLADRSLALSHEERGGTISAFVNSLQVPDKERSLAESAIYRGIKWRRLEHVARVAGISAVACFEHSLFQKGVGKNEEKKVVRYLRRDVFKPIKQLAEASSPLLNEAQRAFNNHFCIGKYQARPLESQVLTFSEPSSATSLVSDRSSIPDATTASREEELANASGTPHDRLGGSLAPAQQVLLPGSNFGTARVFNGTIVHPPEGNFASLGVTESLAPSMIPPRESSQADNYRPFAGADNVGPFGISTADDYQPFAGADNIGPFGISTADDYHSFSTTHLGNANAFL